MAGVAGTLTPSSPRTIAEIQKRYGQILVAMTGGADKGLRQAAAFVVVEIRRSLSLEHSGPIYGGNSPNPASLPGEPPALQSGELRDSYDYASLTPGVVLIGSDSKYAPFLEYGTVKMAPRPHFRAGIEEGIKNAGAYIHANIAREVHETVKGVG